MANTEKCVCCGEVIPEGRQVCPSCERKKVAELKPCPFCGGSAMLKVVESVFGNKTILRCTRPDCYMSYQNGFTSWHNGDTKEHAELRLTTAWNRRAEDGR